MTARDWRADRRAVFERDGYCCQRCGQSAPADELRTHPVGAIPPERRTVHESLLATVCDPCFSTLRGDQGEEALTRQSLFDLVRTLTKVQGQAIADTAGFASLATDLPAALESGDPTNYPNRRRELLLTVEYVDRQVHSLPEDPPYAASSDLEAFREAAADSQAEVRRVVELVEALVAGLGRCHVCFDLRTGDEDRCSSCGTTHKRGERWRDDEGTMSFEALYAAINGTLAETSRRTESLTGHAMTLADSLTEE